MYAYYYMYMYIILIMRDTLAVGEPLFVEEVHVYISPTDVSFEERRVLSYGQGVGCNSCVQGT